MRTLLLVGLRGRWRGRSPPSPGAAAIDTEINRAIEKQLIPGAVVEIGHDGAVVYRKAYGSRALVPKRNR